MSLSHLGSTSRTAPADLTRQSRHRGPWSGVTGQMGIMRAALPFVRSLFFAAVATALIMIGLPAVLALGAAVN
jgi:hypothetical protein